MKRGTKLFLVNPQHGTAGPFPWTMVRYWYALSLLGQDAWVCVEGEEIWRGLSEHPDLCTLPQSLTRPQSSIGHYGSPDRFRKPSTPTQHVYLQRLDCPFSTDGLDFHLAGWIIQQLASLFPERADHAIHQQIEEEGQDPNFWYSDPATPKQRDYLATRGITLPDNASKGQAAAMIDPATDGQLRRLAFYGARLPTHLTKQFASTLISEHVRKHPESEERYQQWKLNKGVS